MTDEHTLANVRGGAAVGAVYGGLLGALIGWIISSIPDPMPVIGPVVGQGVIATTLVALLAGAGLGALLGALFGAFSTSQVAAPDAPQVHVAPPVEEEVPVDMEVEPFTLDPRSTPPFGLVPPRQVDMDDDAEALPQVDIKEDPEPTIPVQEEVAETVLIAQEDIPDDVPTLLDASSQPKWESEPTVSESEASGASQITPRVRRAARRIVREQQKDL